MQVVVHTSIDLPPPLRAMDDDDEVDDDGGGGQSNLAISRGRAEGMYHAFDAMITQ